MANIRHHLIIKASNQVVFDAITTQEGLRAWWTNETDAKAEVGYVNHFKFGSEYFNEMKISKLNAPVMIHWDCINGPEEWIGTKLSFELENKDGDTFLRFAHMDWAAETDFYGSCNYHWGYYLESLKSLCETGKGQPFEGE